MGRKNQIEGQLNFLELLMTGTEEVKTDAVEERGAAVEANTSVDKVSAVQGKGSGQPRVLPGKFKECISCWCATCEHSTVGGGVPRPFGEVMRACPSCELCIKEGKADVCVIGSAEEGCRYRAEKEGFVE